MFPQKSNYRFLVTLIQNWASFHHQILNWVSGNIWDVMEWVSEMIMVIGF